MAQAQANAPLVRAASADITDPTTSTIFADTGALDGGIYDVQVLAGASAAAKFALQVRNAANDANVGVVHGLYCGAGALVWPTVRVQLNPGERVRLTMLANLTGTAAGSLIAQRVA